jgi:hypothetical protein
MRITAVLCNDGDLLAERAIAISHETVRIWWNWVGRMLATRIRKRSVAHMHSYPRRRRRCSAVPVGDHVVHIANEYRIMRLVEEAGLLLQRCRGLARLHGKSGRQKDRGNTESWRY